MSDDEDTTYGLGDYIGDVLAFGVSEENEDNGWTVRDDAVFTKAAGENGINT